MMVKGIFFHSFKGRKITKIEVNGELFSVTFSDGEVLENININELNHVVSSATGR